MVTEADDSARERTRVLAQVDRAARALRRELQLYESLGGRYIDRAGPLPAEALEECRFLPDRLELLTRVPKYGVVAEVGTDTGAFASQIVKLAQPRKLHLFELDISRIDPANVDKHVQSGMIQIHEGDSAGSLSDMPAEYFDWVYIDGDHRYEGVKKDIEASLRCLKKDGWLVFNDYTVWSLATMHRCGVAKAVNELVAQGGWKLMYFAFQPTMYFDVAITRRG